MSRQRDTVYIPRPSKAVYELGLELTESAHIPDQFQGFHRNGVHALAVSLGEDFGKVRAIAEAPPYRRYDEMEYMRKRAGIERSDLQLAGESLIALSRDRQEILSVLDIIEPGLLLSSGYSTFDTVVKMVVTASYTELCAAETTRTRSLGDGRTLSSAHGYSLHADRPQNPIDRADSARVIAVRTLGETISDDTAHMMLPMTDGPEIIELSAAATSGVEGVIWDMSAFLNSAVGQLTPG